MANISTDINGYSVIEQKISKEEEEKRNVYLICVESIKQYLAEGKTSVQAENLINESSTLKKKGWRIKVDEIDHNLFIRLIDVNTNNIEATTNLADEGYTIVVQVESDETIALRLAKETEYKTKDDRKRYIYIYFANLVKEYLEQGKTENQVEDLINSSPILIDLNYRIKVDVIEKNIFVRLIDENQNVSESQTDTIESDFGPIIMELEGTKDDRNIRRQLEKSGLSDTILSLPQIVNLLIELGWSEKEIKRAIIQETDLINNIKNYSAYIKDIDIVGGYGIEVIEEKPKNLSIEETLRKVGAFTSSLSVAQIVSILLSQGWDRDDIERSLQQDYGISYGNISFPQIEPYKDPDEAIEIVVPTTESVQIKGTFRRDKGYLTITAEGFDTIVPITNQNSISSKQVNGKTVIRITRILIIEPKIEEVDPSIFEPEEIEDKRSIIDNGKFLQPKPAYMFMVSLEGKYLLKEDYDITPTRITYQRVFDEKLQKSVLRQTVVTESPSIIEHLYVGFSVPYDLKETQEAAAAVYQQVLKKSQNELINIIKSRTEIADSAIIVNCSPRLVFLNINNIPTLEEWDPYKNTVPSNRKIYIAATDVNWEETIKPMVYFLSQCRWEPLLAINHKYKRSPGYIVNDEQSKSFYKENLPLLKKSDLVLVMNPDLDDKNITIQTFLDLQYAKQYEIPVAVWRPYNQSRFKSFIDELNPFTCNSSYYNLFNKIKEIPNKIV